MKNKTKIKYAILIVTILDLISGYFYLKNYETRIYGCFDMIEEKKWNNIYASNRYRSS
ncbi:MAG: hypothetical protein ACLUVC_00540 [Longibaculum sp.]